MSVIINHIPFYLICHPLFSPDVQAFVLNFNGRVDKPSVKNFQLIDENDGFMKNLKT